MLLLLFLCLLRTLTICLGEYLVGLGRADITGPIADLNMMGYANAEQIAGGLHTRLYARTLIVADSSTPQTRVVFVNLDACMAAQAVTFTVVGKLKLLYGPEMYNEQNVALSGTHTHSGPAGYLQYLVYDFTGLGFAQETFDALVEGIVLSISRAHENLQPGKLSVGKGLLYDVNINRSPTAYSMNPQYERDMFEHNVDKEMTLLRIDDANGNQLGSFAWFPVHGTSMNNTNTLINGDNKGAASLFMERAHGDQFVAAFCQANVADTSPNILGAFCIDTGLPCDPVHSTCDGKVQKCIGRGPGWPDHFSSTRIIAERQVKKAEELLAKSGGKVFGSIESRHKFLDMRSISVRKTKHTREGKTCKPAMGFAFAAGTTDGPGAFDFTQSDTNGTMFWKLVRDFITKPTKEQEECHKPKPILLDVGEMHYPYEWAPYIVEIQIMKIGNLVLLCVPGEFTTMSGRRLIRAVKEQVSKAWGDDLHFVIAGLTNTYSSYITTFEEYQVQRYEGGFTLFGPHTLDAYIQEFKSLATCMIDSQSCESGPAPPNLLADQWSLVPGVVMDAVPLGKNFGDTIKEPKKQYRPNEVVIVEFHAACPRNNFKLEGSYLTVEKQLSSRRWFSYIIRMYELLRGDRIFGAPYREWKVVFTDADWETKFFWFRKQDLSPYSYARIEWTIPKDAEPGTYRIRYFGDHKDIFGQITSFSGSSINFNVVNYNKFEY